MEGLSTICLRNTKVIIVGTFPSEQSLKYKEYYSNPANKFWNLLGDVLGINLKVKGYDEKIEALLENKIGLSDTIIQCEREKSSDKDIINPEFNDFRELDCPKLRIILANGQKAYDNLWKECCVPRGVRIDKLISSSGARVMKYQEKLENWKWNFHRYQIKPCKSL